MHPHHHVRAHHEAHARAHVRKAGYARGGHVAHSDEAEDRALVDRMVKKEALTGKKSGGHVKGHHAKARADRRARGGRMTRRDDGGPVPKESSQYNQANSQLSSPAYQALLNELANSQLNQAQQQPPQQPKMGEKRGGRMARGGHVKGKGSVNIVIATGGGEPERQMAQRQGMQLGAALGRAAAGPPRPPMPPPSMGAPPPGMPPRPPMAPPGMPPGDAPPPMGAMKRGGRLPKMHDEWVEKHGAGENPHKEWRKVQEQSKTVRNFAGGGKIYPLHNAGGGGAEGRVQKTNAMPDVHGRIKVRAHERRRGGSCG